MIDLKSKIWSTLEGGYRVPYDVSVPLKLLEASGDQEQTNTIWKVLWEELHHQGDVGLASYLAVPQLTRIAKSKSYFDRNLIELCSVIEQQRHEHQNPPIPERHLHYYLTGLAELKEIILQHIHDEMDNETYRICLAGLATVSGRINLGKAISILDEDVLSGFLKQFG